MICLSSGESEQMALVGGPCEGIATRDPWSKMCNCSHGTIVLCTDSAALGFVKRKGVDYGFCYTVNRPCLDCRLLTFRLEGRFSVSLQT